jgi:hypothetical protein
MGTSRAASTTYRLAFASLVCGIVPLGLALIAIVSRKHSGFLAFGFMPAAAAVLMGGELWQGNPDKRISRIGRYAFFLAMFGACAVMWATGWDLKAAGVD